MSQLKKFQVQWAQEGTLYTTYEVVANNAAEAIERVQEEEDGVKKLSESFKNRDSNWDAWERPA